MNCEQFENRIQYLLDKRSRLSSDSELTQHAQVCESCAALIPIYQSMVDYAPQATEPQTVWQMVAHDHVDQLHASESHGESPGDKVSRRVTPSQTAASNFLAKAYSLIAVATCLCVIAIGWQLWSPWGSPTNRQAIHVDQAPLASNVHVEAERRYRKIDLTDIAQMTSFLPDPSHFDLQQVSQIDVVSLLPEKPARAIQVLPHTLQNVAPYWQGYSFELPGITTSWSYHFQQLFRLFWKN